MFRLGMSRLAAACLSVVFLAACTGSLSDFGLITPAQEQQLGAQEHPKIVEAYGGRYDDGDIQRYVQDVAYRLRAVSDSPDMPLTVTVLDSPVINAMALPGGFVYVTRGLLALANSEAELAGVLAHEIGHVLERHSAERIQRSTLAGLGAAALGGVTGSDQIGSLANTLGGLYVLRYSRNQEYEADRVGVRLLAKAGYDPMAEADFLRSLDAWSALEQAASGGRGGPPEFLSSHPNTADRVEEAIREARSQGVTVRGAERNAAGYLQRIDGLAWGPETQPLALNVIPVPSGASVGELSGRMAVSQYREELFRVLNAVQGDRLRAGTPVKLVE